MRHSFKVGFSFGLTSEVITTKSRPKELTSIFGNGRPCNGTSPWIALYPKVEKKIREVHPYKLPAIVSYKIESGSSEYLRWIGEETDGKNIVGIDEKTDEDIAKKSIKRTRDFFNNFEFPFTLREVKIDDKYFNQMCESLSNRFGGIR